MFDPEEEEMKEMSLDAERKENDVPLKDILLLLQEAGVVRCIASFSGSGDSGNLDDVSIESLVPGEKIGAMPLSPQMLLMSERVLGIAVSSLHRFLHEWADRLIQLHVDWDWYNNEGGGGQIEIEPFTGRVVVSGYYNEIQEVPADGIDFSIVDDPDFTPLTEEQRAEVKRLRELAANG